MPIARTIHVSDPQAMYNASMFVRRGSVIVIPTETFYGVAADAMHEPAAMRIFDIKGRSKEMALPVVAACVEQVEEILGPMDPATAKAARALWPGAISFVLAASPKIAFHVHGGAGTVAVRVPDHAWVRELAAEAGTLITATSANRSGKPAITQTADLDRSLRSEVDLIFDDGVTRGGKPSTIVDLRGDVPKLIRDGAVPWSRVLHSLK